MDLTNQLSDKQWLVEESGLDLKKLNFYETIFTIGNGYQGTRGALEESVVGQCTGTYLNGIYDHHDSTVIDLVNAPNWLPLVIWVEGIRLDVKTATILQHRRVLDLRQGILYRLTRFQDSKGRITRYESLRFASFASPNLCAIEAQITPENYDGEITIDSAIDGRSFNLDRLPKYSQEQHFDPEVKWEKWAKSKHLNCVATLANEDSIYLESETIDTGHRLGYAASLRIPQTEVQRNTKVEYEKVSEQLSFYAEQGKCYRVEKTVVIFTSREVEHNNVQASCISGIKSINNEDFKTSYYAHKTYWLNLWDDCDCIITGDPSATLALRFNIYHLLISANKNDPRVNIGAKTLSGEGYKGHVFWDTEIFMLPFFIYTQPETAKALLLYRYHTLQGAQSNAEENGFKGAQYPWEGADTGVETTPKWTADGAHRIWTGEREIHVTADVAYGVVTYLTATDDWSFFINYGAEILFNTARFWHSRLEYNPTHKRYELSQVIGPDEFHEHVDNNVFTNWMAKWNLNKAVDYYHELNNKHGESFSQITLKLNLSEDEVAIWSQMAEAIFIPFDEQHNLIEQFEGYFQRKEVPITEFDNNNMPKYPQGYDHFNADETTLLKQPDVVMLMFVLPDEFDDEVKRTNYAYYEKRTLHKSSLSPCIHSIMGIEVGDTDKAMQYFLRSALVDLTDNQGNSEWGIHAASTGGTWMSVVFGFGGLRIKNGQLTFKPWLPQDWQKLDFKLHWQGDKLSVTIDKNKITFLLDAEPEKKLDVIVQQQTITLIARQQIIALLN